MLFAASGFYFDKDKRLAFDRDDVDFAETMTMASEENFVALSS